MKLSDSYSAIKKITNEEILQQNLTSLRLIAGWSVDELATKIGLSRTAVYNLESGTTKLSTTQYMAIMFRFTQEIEKNNNELLEKVLETLLSDDVDYIKKQSGIQEALKVVAASAAAGIAITTLIPLTGGLFSAIGIGTLISSAIRTDKFKWLSKFF